MEVGFPVAGNAVRALLETACQDLYHHVEQVGDGVIEHGFFQLNGANDVVSLLAWNTNNHRTTYSVVLFYYTCALSPVVGNQSP